MNHEIWNPDVPSSRLASTIEDDIKRGQNNPIFVNAVPKWQRDLKYINEYVAQKKMGSK